MTSTDSGKESERSVVTLSVPCCILSPAALLQMAGYQSSAEGEEQGWTEMVLGSKQAVEMKAVCLAL